jgi:hypothetical protein
MIDDYSDSISAPLLGTASRRPDNHMVVVLFYFETFSEKREADSLSNLPHVLMFQLLSLRQSAVH